MEFLTLIIPSGLWQLVPKGCFSKVPTQPLLDPANKLPHSLDRGGLKAMEELATGKYTCKCKYQIRHSAGRGGLEARRGWTTCGHAPAPTYPPTYLPSSLTPDTWHSWLSPHSMLYMRYISMTVTEREGVSSKLIFQETEKCREVYLKDA